MSRTDCKSPWVGVFIETDGSVKSCCAGSYYWGNLHNNTIEEIITDPKVIQIKQGIIKGEQIEYCKGCQRDDETNGYSLRNYYDQFTINQSLLADPTAFVLRNIDIRWNALCNLACAYCNSQSSTRWQGLRHIPIESLDRKYYEQVLEFIEGNAQDLEIILLVGGEPLLPKQNKSLLDNVSESVHIDIISNLSINLDFNQVFQRIKHKKNVGWKASFETIGQRFEYVRNGANWSQFVDNIQQVKNLPGHNITALPVYCIYSAFNLTDIYDFVYRQGIEIHWQPLWIPHYLDVKNFSSSIKQLAIDEINKALSLPYIDKFNQGMNRVFLENTRRKLETVQSTDCNLEFKDWTETYESKYAEKNIKFQTLWPEIYHEL